MTMSGGQRVRRKNRRVPAGTLRVVLALVAAAAFCAPVTDEPGDPASKPKVPRRRPLVVMKQSEIRTRVIFLADEETEEQPAARQRIEIRTLSGRKVIRRAKTDGEGRCILPSLDAGRYQLIVGRLRLELCVEDAAGPRRPLPKTILILMPCELGERAGESESGGDWLSQSLLRRRVKRNRAGRTLLERRGQRGWCGCA